MAATATYTLDNNDDWGRRRITFSTITVSSYDSTGITLTPSKVGLRYIDFAMATIIGAAGANGPVSINWDKTNNLLLAYKASNTAVDNATAFTLAVMAIGT